MSLRPVFNVVGVLLVFLAAAMGVTALVSLLYQDGDTVSFLTAAGITLGAGLILYRVTRFEGDITLRQGYAAVTFAWTFVAVFGALPFVLTGVLESPVQGVFEAMSGFTTTGATVFSDIELLPHGILFWRSVTHWLGGMGIIVLAIAVLPYLGVGGMQLFRAEVPGPTPERLRPRIAQTAKLLWYVYVGMTGLQVALYLVGGLSLFESVNHAMATLATGGFSTRNDSAAGFSPYLQYVTIFFMYMAGVNFTLHFRAASGRLSYFKDVEWRFFTLVVVGSGLLMTVLNMVSGTYRNVEHAFRHGMFQVTSIVTTTGFVSTDYEAWIPAAQGLLLALMFVGGMAGSTGGSIKAVRVLLTLKYVGIQIKKHLHPRAVLLARLGNRAVKDDVLGTVVGFVFLYCMLCLFGVLLMSLLGMDLLTAFGATAATIGNIGPGLGAVGATDNYGWINDAALAGLTFLMMVGRLEIYTVLLLFHPDMWKRRSAVVRKTMPAGESMNGWVRRKPRPSRTASAVVEIVEPDEDESRVFVEEDSASEPPAPPARSSGPEGGDADPGPDGG